MITGHTQLFGIIANPIAQVRTPQVLNTIFEQRGIDAILVPIQVDTEALPKAFEAFRGFNNMGGFIVTVPHKTIALHLCDEVSVAAKNIGAVNTIRREENGRLVGDMFDGRGFVRGLVTEGRDPAGRHVLLVGAGGAAAAIGYALAEAGVGSLTIANRTRAKAEDLAARIDKFFPAVRVVAGDANPQGYDMIINSTSLGMSAGDELPFQADLLESGQLVAEIIMKPERTPIMDIAGARGCVVHEGFHMLTNQAELMVNYMLGQEYGVSL